MMESTLEMGLQDLLHKGEIHDVLMRYCRGVDRGDQDLIVSSFHSDATIDAGKGKITPADIARTATSDDHIQTHLYGNCLIELVGDVAWSETYFLAFHVDDRKGKRFMRTRSARAIDQFERRSGVWKIAKRVVADDWSRVDEIVEYAAGVPVTGRRSHEDPVYQFKEDRSS